MADIWFYINRGYYLHQCDDGMLLHRAVGAVLREIKLADERNKIDDELHELDDEIRKLNSLSSSDVVMQNKTSLLNKQASLLNKQVSLHSNLPSTVSLKNMVISCRDINVAEEDKIADLIKIGAGTKWKPIYVEDKGMLCKLVAVCDRGT